MEFRSEKDILFEMIDKAEEKGLININEDLKTRIEQGYDTENQFLLDYSCHAYIISTLESTAETIYNNMNIETATGQGLDNLGALLNVIRYPAQSSRVNIEVNRLGEADEIIEIPAGTKVILIDAISANSIVEFYTIHDATIEEGVNSTTIQAESNELGAFTKIPSGAVIGLNDFTTELSAVNNEESTGGRNIESDDEYRQRIRNWYLKSLTGTYANIADYLLNYDGLMGFRLIPRWDGVGTLKIICDCLESELDNIRQGVQDNCMIYTDDPVICELPATEHLENLKLFVHIDENAAITYTLNEFENLILYHARAYIEGGTGRAGTVTPGLKIGQEFDPARLISFILNEIPEIANIYTNIIMPVHIPENSKLVINSYEVVFE